MIIQNVSALLGLDLEYKESVDIRMQNGIFTDIGEDLDSTGESIHDGQGLLAVPGFVNCHTHIGDSIAKDISLGLDVKGGVHPVYGVKSRVLNRTEPNHLVQFMQNTCLSMLAGGTTTFVDFREGGMSGVHMAQSVCDVTSIRGIILGRTNKYQDKNQIKNNIISNNIKNDLKNIIVQADGLGVSGANENSDAVLELYSETLKIRAIHAAETAESVQDSYDITGRGEVERALLMKPHFLVHMVHASDAELNIVSEARIGVVACPRSNAVLSGAIPDISKMVNMGCIVALGTDNIMVNSPDMFREMEFAWKTSNGRLTPHDILRMATVNGGRVLGMRLGAISVGYMADLTLFEKHHISMEPMHNPYAALVHRACADTIRAVVVNGSIVHGSM